MPIEPQRGTLNQLDVPTTPELPKAKAPEAWKARDPRATAKSYVPQSDPDAEDDLVGGNH